MANVPGVLVSFGFRQMPWGSGERRPALNAGQLRKGVADRGLGDCGVVPCAGRDVGKVRRCLRIGLHERQVAAAAKHAVEDSHRLGARDGLVRVERAIRIAADPAVGIGRSDRIMTPCAAYIGKRHALGRVRTVDPGQNGHEFRAGDGLARLERAVAVALDGAGIGQRADRDHVPLAGRNIAEAIVAAVILLVRLCGHELIEQLGRLGARERAVGHKGGRGAAGNIGVVVGRIQQAGRLRRLRAGAAAAVVAHLGNVLFQQRHRLLERDGAAVVERTDDRHNVLQVHIRRRNELRQQLRDLIVCEDAAGKARQDGIDAGLRHTKGFQDLGKRLLGGLAVRAAGGNVADDLTEVDVHRVAGDGDDAVHVVIVAGDVLEQIAHVHVHDAVDEIAVAANVVDQILNIYADNAVNEVIVIGDVDPAQDLTEQAVVQLAIGRVGCAGLRLRGVCRESRDSSETECQHQGQYQAQCLAHFFHGILPPLSSKQTYMEKVAAKCRTQVSASHRHEARSLF